MPPLILTIHFDPVSQARFDEYRGRYFPPERNIVPAHLTLFHQLEQTERTFLTLDTVAKEQGAFSVAVTGLRSLGRGGAFALESKPLERLHAVVPGRIYISAMPTYRGLELEQSRHHFKTIINLFPEDTWQRSPLLPQEERFVRETGVISVSGGI